MLDFILGLFLAALLVRGWTRGFVREALDLVGLVVGIWIAFKLSGPFGEFLISRFGVSPEIAVIGAGIVLFLLFGVSMSVVAHYLSKVMHLPGLNLINRFGGAVVATAWAVALLLVVINVARVFPLPESWDDALDESTIVELIAGEEAVPQQLFERFGSDNVLGSLAALQSLFGSARAVPEGDEVLTIPPAAEDEIRQVRDEANELLGFINEFRTGEGLRALESSVAFTGIAEDRAVLTYTTGRISRDNPPGQSLSDDLRSAGLRLGASGENIALASSVRAAFDAMLDSTTGRTHLTTAAYDRVGVAVVDGPTGRLVIIDFGG
jgi:uncharacterized membrane protein required for colicin V production